MNDIPNGYNISIKLKCVRAYVQLCKDVIVPR